MTDLIKIEENAAFEIFQGVFEGQPCRFRKNKATGEILIFMSDVAKCLGYESELSMMLDVHNNKEAPEELKEMAAGFLAKEYGIIPPKQNDVN